MSLAVVHSRALVGVLAPEVRVEVHLANGLPALHLVGLPQAAVRESADRVRAALLQSGHQVPSRRITVNLTPADLPKDSGRFDLPIAIGILAASEQVPVAALRGLAFVGELSLTGQIRPIRGALAMLRALHIDAPGTRLVLPADCAPEAALLPDGCALLAAHLTEVCAHLTARRPLPAVVHHTPPPALPAGPDLASVRGHVQAKRALEIAAAGGHSLLMVGPPGAGKSLLASCLAGLLPPLAPAQALESALVASVSSGFTPSAWARRPLRAPHHSASVAALVGGGNPPRPGEITLAHQGVLFLDELPEFPRAALEALREPLETGTVTLSRAARQATYPARFQLVAAMNPCPCGYQGAPGRRCVCPPGAAARYRQRLSGPLLDRIDLQIDVTAVSPAELLGSAPAGSAHADPQASAATARRVATAQARALQRQGALNAALGPAELDTHCQVDAAALALVQRAAQRWHWSARTLHRVLRVARSIADLAGQASVLPAHAAEAVAYRHSAILGAPPEPAAAPP
ncbi:MAG: YifB family Mg chelatase-like AAA ATPase [Betaproteobacteria bacterium]|nr:YifB family Mg chelatase-like AAA ATPase [Betaproteobacteria bacterium]